MVLVIAFFVALRDRWSMWLDEAFSSVIVRQSAPHLARQLWDKEANQAPYYGLLWGWSRISDAVWFERSLSLVGTLVAIWGVWLLAKRWSGPACGAVSVAVFCTLPFTLAWSLQARGYTWVMAVMAWAMVALDLCADRKSRWWAVAAGAGIGVCTAISLSTACIAAPVLLTILAIERSRRTLADVAVVVGCALLAFSPFAWAFATNRDQISWIPPLSWAQVQGALIAAVGTRRFILILMLGLVGCAAAVARGRATPRALTAVMGCVGGVVLLALVSALIQPMFVGRYLAAAIPLVAVACGVAVTLVRFEWRRAAAGLAIAVVVGTLMASLGTVRPHPIEDWRGAGQLIGAAGRDDDLIAVVPRDSNVAMLRYWPSNIDSSGQAFVVRDGRGNARLVRADGRSVGAQRVWLVIERIPQGLSGTDKTFLRSVEDRWGEVRRVRLDGVSVFLLGGSRDEPSGSEAPGVARR